MSGHLCLKWNNHSTAFLKSIVSIQLKEKYCDATIACQGKYFPVHRVILSTCSDYFEEMFERIQCPHPYIVFKDIEPKEMELLLNYMYRGEVNVIQEQLPTLIKAAEALKIKGLAVPDDLPPKESGKKRNLPSDETPSKRRADDRRKRRNSSDLHPHSANRSSDMSLQSNDDELRIIKQEPVDPCDYQEPSVPNEFSNAGGLPSDSALPMASESEGVRKAENVFVDSFSGGESSFIKSESEDPGDHGDLPPTDDTYDEQASSWSDFASSDMQNLDVPQTSQQDDMTATRPQSNISKSLGNRHSQFLQHGSHDQGKAGISTMPAMTLYQRLHYCPYCSYKSSNVSHVKRHAKFKHTGERPFSCNLCSRRFAVKQQLVNHRRIHTGEKPFECPECSRRFSERGNMKKHRFTVHSVVI